MKIKMSTSRRGECAGCDKKENLHAADSGVGYCHDCAVEIISLGNAEWDDKDQPSRQRRIGS